MCAFLVLLPRCFPPCHITGHQIECLAGKEEKGKFGWPPPLLMRRNPDGISMSAGKLRVRVGAFFWHRTEPEQRTYRFYRLLQLLPPGLSNIPRKGRLKDSRWLSLESRACHFLCPEKWRSYMCLQSACYRPHLQEPEEEHSVEKPGPMLNHKQLQGCSEWICFSEW